MLPSSLEVLEYLDTSGRSPFGDWFDGLNAQAAAKISIALARLRQGNSSNIKRVGGGVMEYKVDFGPGYRVYFGRNGERIVVLLAGGTKRRQNEDIRLARTRWSDYKRRKA
jgi:putative addiction module killer protein